MGSASLFEARLSHDENLLTGGKLARVQYRRPDVRKWSRFVVVLDEETTWEMVAVNLQVLCLEHERVSR